MNTADLTQNTPTYVYRSASRLRLDCTERGSRAKTVAIKGGLARPEYLTYESGFFQTLNFTFPHHV